MVNDTFINGNTNSNKVKLIDFGFAVQLKAEALIKVFCGTPCYMAPEMVSR